MSICARSSSLARINFSVERRPSANREARSCTECGNTSARSIHHRLDTNRILPCERISQLSSIFQYQCLQPPGDLERMTLAIFASLEKSSEKEKKEKRSMRRTNPSVGFSGRDESNNRTNLWLMERAASQEICWPLSNDYGQPNGTIACISYRIDVTSAL